MGSLGVGGTVRCVSRITMAEPIMENPLAAASSPRVQLTKVVQDLQGKAHISDIASKRGVRGGL